ncbi:hypothetical protein DICSQDRAFT_179719 [Dichomitus squalens LYAD-421 SS1]|uniref:uncharacterized protein n=1 Tax=Dichomitus squalens (strain LYAD-421) TaxID=732165 RepID=UPI00044155A4|nr:uncharacterized protein DICSQDRAFT_179719 [Dichomitus squalens LYAD-421 SS1]EJF63065.1 hypothetical protein DICSQDRAFT_179719 [Dichomitus squalens LYAD-421 SS1]
MLVDPPYPSFTLVMIAADPSLRLPSYRSSHLGRFHPYPRGGSRRSEDRDIFVNAYMYTEGSSTNVPAQPCLRPARRCVEVPDNDVSSFELDPPVVGVEYDEYELRAFSGVPTGLSRSKLAEALADLLGELCRRCSQLTLGTLFGTVKSGVERPK